MSKKTKAIAGFQHLLAELDSVENVQQGNTWKAALSDLLSLYLGPNSALQTRLSVMHFTVKTAHSSRDYYYTTNEFRKENTQNFRELLNKAITHINTNGLYRDPQRNNFLAHFSNLQMLSTVGGFSLLVLSAGIFLGNLQKDRDILASERKVEEVESKYKKCQEHASKLEAKLDLQKVMRNK